MSISLCGQARVLKVHIVSCLCCVVDFSVLVFGPDVCPNVILFACHHSSLATLCDVDMWELKHVQRYCQLFCVFNGTKDASCIHLPKLLQRRPVFLCVKCTHSWAPVFGN